MRFTARAGKRAQSRATATDVNDHGHRVKDVAHQADTDRSVRPEDFTEADIRNPRHTFLPIRRGTCLLASAAVAATLLAACDGGTSKLSAPPPAISPPMSLGAAARLGTAPMRPGVLVSTWDRRRRNCCGSAPSRLGDRAIRGREHTDLAPPTIARGRPDPDAGLCRRPQPGSGVDSAVGGVRRFERYHVVADGGAPRRQRRPPDRDWVGGAGGAAGRTGGVGGGRAGIQRIVVSDLDANRKWVAAAMPRCIRGRCYRIDAVTLSDSGVVLSAARSADNPHWSSGGRSRRLDRSA